MDLPLSIHYSSSPLPSRCFVLFSSLLFSSLQRNLQQTNSSFKLKETFLSQFLDQQFLLGDFEGLAGLKTVAVRIVSNSNPRKKKKKKKTKKTHTQTKVKVKFMEFWNKMIFPVKRVLVAVSARVKARKNGARHLKLHDDVQTCEYQDVQVMWEMLRRSETEVINPNPKRRQ